MTRYKSKVFLMTLFFAFMAIGPLFAQTDNRLNGRWEAVIGELTLEYRFNRGEGWVSDPDPKNGKWIFYTWDTEKRTYIEIGEIIE